MTDTDTLILRLYSDHGRPDRLCRWPFESGCPPYDRMGLSRSPKREMFPAAQTIAGIPVASPSKFAEALKRRRLQQNLTLEQLSAKSGVSRAAISKIERGDSGASTPVLGKLAEALDLSISQLVGGPRSAPVLRVPRDRQPVFVEKATGFERRSLSPMYLGRGIDFVLNRLPPKAKTGPFPSHRLGVEEHLYVTKGRLKVTLDGDEQVLEAGDFLFYRGDLSHTFENLANTTCEYFIVIDSTRLR